MKATKLLLLAYSVAASVTLLADPAPVTVTISGHPLPVVVSGVGSGGIFSGSINGVSGFDFYCVDSQNYINGIPTTFNAYLGLITTDGWDPSITRYGTVGDPGGRDWAYGTVADSALFRYRIAAYLTTLYDTTAPLDTGNNQLIQRAIWRALDTNPPSGPSYTANDAQVLAKYNAAANYAILHASDDSLWDDYRVVSGWYHGGLRDVDNLPCFDEAQTYLTVVPEPGSGLLLAAGFAAILLLARRARARR